MSTVNKVLQLPAEVRQELDARLRAAAYGDLVNISTWVTDRAYPISKSGLHRYALGLKATDAARGNEDTQLQVAIRNASSTAAIITGRKAQILLQLGRLELQKAALMAELGPLMVGDPSRDHPTLADAESDAA